MRRKPGTTYEMTDILTGDSAKGINPAQVVQRLYQIETARINGDIVSGNVHEVVVTGNKRIGSVKIFIRASKK